MTNLNFAGLQTPRLKRLAEIVSAQAMDQQAKIEHETGDVNGAINGNGHIGAPNGLDLALHEVEGEA